MVFTVSQALLEAPEQNSRIAIALSGKSTTPAIFDAEVRRRRIHFFPHRGLSLAVKPFCPTHAPTPRAACFLMEMLRSSVRCWPCCVMDRTGDHPKTGRLTVKCFCAGQPRTAPV